MGELVWWNLARRTARPLGLVLLVLGLMVAAGACSEEEGNGPDDCVGGICAGQNPNIRVDPTSVSFATVPVGESVDELITISNTGEADLDIEGMALSGRDANVFTVNVDRDGTIAEYGGESFTIAPGEDTLIQVVYAPDRVGSAEATLTIQSNDPDNSGVVRVNLVALETGPKIQITPSPIIFGQVPAGEELKVPVTITNIGSAPAPIENISITGSPDFTPDRGTRDSLLTTLEGPLGIGESFQVEIWYRPPTQSPDAGKLNVSYTFDAETRIEPADITANGNEPCIRVRPEEVDFGQAIIGQTSDEIVTIENCGSDNLEVSSIALSSDTDPKFALSMVPESIAGGGAEIIPRGQTRQFYVTYTPEAEEPSTGLMTIESDDPARGVVDVPIFGVGSFNRCPVAIAKGHVVTDSKGSTVLNPDPMTDQFAAEPLSTIKLSATESNDPDGDNEIVEYRWSIIQAPAGFSLNFVNDLAPETEIQLALVGDYVFELIVVDKHGRESCDPALVEVRARSDRALVVELTWRTPSDADETDTCQGCGTDLDLHMLSPAPGAYWTERRNNGTEGDCYFNNDNPNWGNHSETTDDPALDRDDTDGGGPEQINIKAPAYTDGSQPDGYTSPYAVGVYFYDSWEYEPPVLGTVRVYLDGSDVPTAVWPTVPAGAEPAAQFVFADPNLSRMGDFWYVGDIDWSESGGSLTEVNTMHTGFP